MKISLFLIILIFMIGFSSALEIIGQNTFNINKTVDEQFPITFELKNDKPYTFYNITLANNNIATMSKIPTLLSGEIINTTILITTNENFNGPLRLIGFYETTTGPNYETWEVDITSESTRLSKCDFTVVKGDIVQWNNQISYDVIIKDINIPTTFEQIILPQSTFQHIFNQPQSFTYVVWRLGSQYHSPCTITVLEDSGFVNNPDYDTFINLNIIQEYNPTEISINVFEDNYTIDFNSKQEGLMTITNNGSNPAKGITLKADWFKFTPNVFDLEPGYTRAISYEILPILTLTEETNKTYIKNLTITGNFPTIYKEFTIFVNYASIDTSNSFASLITPQLYLSFCKLYPEFLYCNRDKEVVYVPINQSDVEFNVSWSLNKVQQIEDMLLENDLVTTEQFKEIHKIITELFNQTTETYKFANTTSNEMVKFREEMDRRTTTSQVLWFFVGSFVAIGGLFWLTMYLWKQRKIKRAWR